MVPESRAMWFGRFMTETKLVKMKAIKAFNKSKKVASMSDAVEDKMLFVFDRIKEQCSKAEFSTEISFDDIAAGDAHFNYISDKLKSLGYDVWLNSEPDGMGFSDITSIEINWQDPYLEAYKNSK